MQNDIWSEVGIFLNGLRCSNVRRESYIQFPELIEAEERKKVKKKGFQLSLNSLEAEQRTCVEDYLESLRHLAFMAEEQAYCQGYADCIQLLSGLGALKETPDIKKLIKKIKN